ncbi:unnamed protein product [Amaranthus hypochondriacus]
MSGSSKRRHSKWDLKDSVALPANFNDGAQPRRPRESYSPGLHSSRLDSRCKGSSMTLDRQEKSPRMSSELDEWRPRHSSRSPRNGWSQSRRNSKSRSRSRSRSRSPAHNSRREPTVTDWSRSRTGASARVCRDFAVGRCRRGSSCHFLHEDSQLYDRRRPLESSPSEDLESSRRRVGSSKYSPDDSKDNTRRTEKSAHICNDFLKGRCRRGDSCRFVHQDTAVGVFEKGLIEDVYRNKDRDRRSRDIYPDQNHRSRDPYTDNGHRSKDPYPDHEHRRRDPYLERKHEFEPPRRGENTCKFFAAGNCRNGTRCKFSHQVQNSFSPEKRSRDVRRDTNREDSLGWDGPKWSNATAMSAVPEMQCWEEDKKENEELNTVRIHGDGRSSGHKYEGDRDWNGPTWKDATTMPAITGVQGWGEDKNEITEMSKDVTRTRPGDGPTWNGPDHKYEGDRDWNDSTWTDATTMPAITGVQGWGEDKNEITEVSTDTTRTRPGDDSCSHDILTVKPAWDTPASIDQSEIQDDEEPLKWKTEHNVPGIEILSGDIEISPTVINQQNVNSSTSQIPSITNISFPVVQQESAEEASFEKHYSADFLEPKVCSDPFIEQTSSIKDNKHTLISGERRNVFGDRDGPVITQNQSAHVLQGQSIFQPSIADAHPISNINPQGQNQLPVDSHPQVSHNPPSFLDNKVAESHDIGSASSALAPASATEAQLAELSHLTASLTQLLENRQQLSQLSSAVTNLPNLSGPVPAVAGVMIQRNHVPEVLKQYDPVCNTIEPKMPNMGNQLLPSVEQKSSVDELHHHANNEIHHHKSGNVNQQEHLASTKDEENGKKSAVGGIKAPENKPSHDAGADDDDGKKMNDTKGIRSFKFALVEMVKELLKPSWKDGQVSKDDYKTIVKKAVDKVTETLGPQIPQTKDKIDLYLSCSKQKIDKLVQAYVEKYHKS